VAGHLGYDKIVVGNIDAWVHEGPLEDPFCENIIDLGFGGI
jgi:hypothetical protein